MTKELLKGLMTKIMQMMIHDRDDDSMKYALKLKQNWIKIELKFKMMIQFSAVKCALKLLNEGSGCSLSWQKLSQKEKIEKDYGIS